MNRAPRRPAALCTGVTLLELLVAMSLLSLLSLGAVMALRVGLGSMNKVNGLVQGNRRMVGAQRALERQIAGFMPMTAEFPNPPNQGLVRAPFFQGEPQAMRFVSSYSLEEGGRGRPRILEFLVIPGELQRGVRLIVNELLYTGPLSTGALCAGVARDPVSGLPVLRFLPIAIGPQSFVIADKLEHCSFMYLGLRPPPELERWTPQWVQQEWPLAVRIEMAPLDNAAKIPPLTITAPVHVTKDPLRPYADM